MGHNSVVSSHPKSTGIPWVDGLSTVPLDLGCHITKHLRTRHEKCQEYLVSMLVPLSFRYDKMLWILLMNG